MRIALAFILTLMLCLTGPAQIAFACGGGGGNEGVDESASTQTSDPDEPPPGFILSGDTPPINVGESGPSSDPGDSITAPPPQSMTVVIETPKPFIGPREPMTRQQLIKLNRQMQELNRRSIDLELQERALERLAWVAAFAAATIASGGTSAVAAEYGVGVAWTYITAYAVGTSLIESRGDPVAALESTIGTIQTFEHKAIVGPAKSTTITSFLSVNSPESVPVFY